MPQWNENWSPDTPPGSNPTYSKRKCSTNVYLLMSSPHWIRMHHLQHQESLITQSQLEFHYLDLGEAHIVQGVFCYQFPAGVPLQQMAVVLNLPAIPSKETPAPTLATEDMVITKAKKPINTTMYIMITVSEASTVQMSQANEPRYGGY